MCEKVSDRAKSREIAGKVGVLKLKTSKHRLITRRLTFKEPTNIADRLFSALEPLLKNEIKEVRFRLLGVTLMDLCDQKYADLTGDLLDPYSKIENGQSLRVIKFVKNLVVTLLSRAEV